MRFGAGSSQVDDTVAAVDQALAAATAGMSGPPDLVMVFATPHHTEAWESVARQAAAAVGPGGTAIGCVAEGVIAGRQELEAGPAVAAWAAHLPQVTCTVARLEAVRLEEGLAISGWREANRGRGCILIADPFTFPIGGFLDGLNRLHPRLPVVGGLAAGDGSPGSPRFFVDDEVFHDGAVAVTLAGAIDFRPVVSQGCRPVGSPVVVTAAEGHHLLGLGGRPALEYLEELLADLPEEEQQLVARGLQLGIVVDEYQTSFEQGDFLIRGVIDADRATGSLTIGESVEVGSTVQFQVRDPDSADDDLRRLLAEQPQAAGVLLFTCNGRGARFFGRPDHDAALVDELLEPAGVAGFFAAGELGPVGSGNFVHGYTASLVELLPAQVRP